MKTKKNTVLPSLPNFFLGFSAAILVASIAYSIGGQHLQGSVSTPMSSKGSFDKPTDAINQYPMGVPTRAQNADDCKNCVSTYSSCHAKGVQALITNQQIIIGEGRNARPISANNFLKNCLNTFKACKQVFQCK